MPRARKRPSMPGTPPPEGRTVTPPTPEQASKAEYARRLVVVNGTEAKPFARTTPTEADRMRAQGILTRQLVEAGEAWAADHRRAFPPPPGRDSCALRVGGMTHETELQAAKIIAAKQRMGRVEHRAGPTAYALMRSLFAHDVNPGSERNERALKWCLTIAAVVYGVPEYRGEKYEK